MRAIARAARRTGPAHALNTNAPSLPRGVSTPGCPFAAKGDGIPVMHVLMVVILQKRRLYRHKPGRVCRILPRF
jgi:hypothetical protein